MHESESERALLPSDCTHKEFVLVLRLPVHIYKYNKKHSYTNIIKQLKYENKSITVGFSRINFYRFTDYEQ